MGGVGGGGGGGGGGAGGGGGSGGLISKVLSPLTSTPWGGALDKKDAEKGGSPGSEAVKETH